MTDTCKTCRAWTRPGPRSMTSTHVRTPFNQEVQADLLFYRSHVVLHLLDMCTRWTVATPLASRSTDEILQAFQTRWFGVFVCDQEGGIAGDYAAAWFERRGVKLKLKAPRQHAQSVEQHHEILRQQLHRMEPQATEDGLRVNFAEMLSEAVYAKNVLLCVGNHSPFEAVLGRTPPLLNVIPEEAEGLPEDRDAFRLRHIAIEAMIQATAQSKAIRAQRHNTSASRRAD